MLYYMRVQRIEINQDIPGHVNTGMATQSPRIKGGILDKLKQAQELLRVNTVWNRIIQRIKNSLDIGSSEKDLIDDIVQIEWAKEKRNERSSNND